jgi:hypothetical protein
MLMGYTLKKTVFEKYGYSTGGHIFSNVKHLLTVPTFLGLSTNL